MNICIICAPANKGKTESVKMIDDFFRNNNEYSCMFTNRITSENDFESIYKNNKHRIGLISIGDKVSEIKQAFNIIKEYSIDYLICTSRTKGETVEYIAALSSKVIRIIKPYFVNDNSLSERINYMFSRFIYDNIFNFFN